MALLAQMLIVFARYAEALDSTPQFFIALGLFLVAALAWSLAMIGEGRPAPRWRMSRPCSPSNSRPNAGATGASCPCSAIIAVIVV